MNPVALITGASRGIGRGIAVALAGIGYDLIVNYAGNEAAAQETTDLCLKSARQRGHSIRAEICQADIGLATDRDRLIGFAKDKLNRLDLLINNAGMTSIGRRDVLEAREEDFDRLMSVNLKGPYFLSQSAANWMITQIESSGAAAFSPKIITITSVSGYAVSTNRGDYCMAKAALGMMTKLFAVRLAEHGIRVYEICPGVIESDMTAPVKAKYDKLFAEGLTPIRRWGTPDDISRAVLAIAQDYLPYSTGEVINVDGGFHIRTL